MLCAKEAETCPWERAKLMLEKNKLIAKCVRVWFCARARVRLTLVCGRVRRMTTICDTLAS